MTLLLVMLHAKTSQAMTKTANFLAILRILALAGVAVCFMLLSENVFYIPYLSPLARFVYWIASPLAPLLFPAFLGLLLKVCQHRTWPTKKKHILITGSWVLPHAVRAILDAFALWHHGDVCGLWECKGKWIKLVLVVVVVGMQARGWKWDNGYVDRWIAHVIKEDARCWIQGKAKTIANGDVYQPADSKKDDKILAIILPKSMKRELGVRDVEETVILMTVPGEILRAYGLADPAYVFT